METGTGLRRWWKYSVAFGLVFVLLLVGADWTRWWALDGRVQNGVVKVSASPTTKEVLAIPAQIREVGRGFWIAPESIEVDMRCEQRVSNGYALKEDQTELYWYLVVDARCRGRKATWVERIDNKLPDTDPDGLEAGGVKIVRKKPQGG